MTCTRIHRLLGFAVLSSFLGGCGQVLLSAYGELDDANEWDEAFDTEESVADEPEEEVDEAEQEDEDDTDEDTPSLECSNEGFDTIATQTTLNETNPDQIRFVHRAVNTTSPPNDELQFVSFQGSPYNGPSTPGTYDVGGQNTADCGLCLLILADCTGPDCKKTFFAKSGTLRIVSMEGIGGSFEAILNDVILEEVTVDPTTYRSTPVTGGERWCLDGVRLDDPYILPGF